MKIKFWMEYGIKFLSKMQTPALDTELLISYITKKSRTWINIFDNYILSTKQIILFQKLLLRRAYGEPIAYIIQNKEFWSLSLSVSNYTLVPRPETEILVQNSLQYLNDGDCILDLGTGCGAISLAIAFENPSCTIIGTDCIYEAINISRYNARNLCIQNAYFFYSNWFSHINKKFNLIVSNPPYLSKDEKFYLSKTLSFEPRAALFAKKNGISEIKYIICHAKKYLLLKGWLLIEHGWQQGELVYKLFQKSFFNNIKVYKDYLGFYRVTAGQKLY